MEKERKNTKKRNLLFEEALKKLPPEKVVIEEEGVETQIRMIVGYKHGEGIFTLREEVAVQNGKRSIRYMLIQDTLGNPVVRGAMIENDCVIKIEGFGEEIPEGERKGIVEQLSGLFLNCDRFLRVKEK